MSQEVSEKMKAKCLSREQITPDLLASLLRITETGRLFWRGLLASSVPRPVRGRVAGSMAFSVILAPSRLLQRQHKR